MKIRHRFLNRPKKLSKTNNKKKMKNNKKKNQMKS